jgi:AraC-like DNA-binding protein
MKKETMEIDEANARRLLQSPPHDDFVAALRVVLKSYREAGFMTAIQVAELADVSVRSLQRLLMQQGLTFSQIDTEVRAGRAVELLRNTSLSVQQIASEVGYSKSNNFSRAFKQWIGKTPEQFRRDQDSHNQSDR